MSLLGEIQSYIKNESDTASNWEIVDLISDVDEVSNEHQGSGRWTEQWVSVFKRGDEYVALEYERPSTEMQEGSEGPSEAYAVEPVVISVTKYVKKTDY